MSEVNPSPPDDDNPRADKTAVTRKLNDELRVHARGNGRVCVSSGIAALGLITVAEILAAIRSFVAFTEDNDPHREHDAALVQVGDTKVLWKVDYYDPTLTFSSADPSDPAATTRVLTVMLPSEY